MTLTLTPSSDLQLHRPTVHRLPDGLTIIAESIPIEAVNLSLWLNVGSAVEADAINGIAHFLEHMVFKGTDRLRSGEFERLVEGRGGVTNAATSQDYTHYYITTAPQDFTALAPHQIDIVLNASIPETEFEQERSVILEEIRRSADNPRRRIFERMMEMAFATLPYRRSVLGPMDVIAAVTPEQMRTFHATWYQPASVSAVVIGNLPVEQLVETVAIACQTQVQFYQHFSPRLTPLTSPYTAEPEPPFTTVVRQEWTDAALQQARLVMMWRVPGLRDLSQTYALDMMASILAHGRTARLVQDLREQQRLVTGISATNLTYQTQGLFYVVAHLSVEHLATVEAAIAQHICQLQAEPVTAAELARVQRQVANRFIFGSETPSDRASLYGYYYSMLGDLEPAFQYPEHIRAIRVEDLQAAAQRYLSPEAYGVVIFKPEA